MIKLNLFPILHAFIHGALTSHLYVKVAKKKNFTIVDEKSKCTWIHLMKTNPETRHHCCQLVFLDQNQHNASIKIIKSVNETN